MSAPSTEQDAFELLDADSSALAKPARVRRTGLLALAVVLLLAAAAAFAASYLIEQRRQATLDALDERIAIMLDGRAETVSVWLSGLSRVGRHLSGSELVQLFLTELAVGDEDPVVAGAASDQARYLRLALDDFAARNALVGAQLLARDGQSILQGGAAVVRPGQDELARRALEQAGELFGGIREVEGRMHLDLYQPIRQLQTPQGETAEDFVGVLLVTFPVAEDLARLLAPSPLAGPGERTRLVQSAAGEAWLVAPPDLQRLPSLDGSAALDGRTLPFGLRGALDGEGEAFSAGIPVAGLPWLLVQEIERDAALAEWRRERVGIIGFTGLSVVVLLALVGIAWVGQTGHFNRVLAEQYRGLAARINAQRRLLDGINGAIREWIGLKRADGTYVYVNPAFAEAVGRPREQIEGTGDEAVFGYKTAQRLRAADEAVLNGDDDGEARLHEVFLQDRRYHVEISRVPLRNETGGIEGVVMLARDITEQFEERQRRERALRQTAEAFDRLVGRVDPYLGGHSALVSSLCDPVAIRLGLSDDDRLTLQIASQLAQVGKLLVPARVLSKEGRLTEEEAQEMRQHVVYAAEIIGGIDFDLPVRETVEQMYERLDGTGYPKGLEGEQIGKLARILGACDVLCARVRPRSYREPIDVAKAVDILAEHPDRYDAKVVGAIRAVVAAGEWQFAEEENAGSGGHG